jgi:hypothetical protein
MRKAVTLCLAAIGLIASACGSAAADGEERRLDDAPLGGARAPVSEFTPPAPPGCAAARDYDACFAIADATPLEVRAFLPRGARANAVSFVRFRRASGTPDPLDLQQMQFKARGGAEVRLYFQVRPGAYVIEVGVDADGDGTPEGPADDLGWSSASPDVPVLDEASAAVVDVGTAPIATSFTVAARN